MFVSKNHMASAKWKVVTTISTGDKPHSLRSGVGKPRVFWLRQPGCKRRSTKLSEICIEVTGAECREECAQYSRTKVSKTNGCI